MTPAAATRYVFPFSAEKAEAVFTIELSAALIRTAAAANDACAEVLP